MVFLLQASEATINGGLLFKNPLQYIEKHDHDRFICNFGTQNPVELGNPLFERGERSNTYRVQPYLIGLLMAKDIRCCGRDRNSAKP